MCVCRRYKRQKVMHAGKKGKVGSTEGLAGGEGKGEGGGAGVVGGEGGDTPRRNT